MFCIGLTGNIASGKSTAMACFHSLNIDVISADAIARELTAIDAPGFRAIKEHFGEGIITLDGALDRKALRNIIFKDKKQRQWLDNLLHPMIRERIQSRVKECTSAYCVIEIPLLYRREDYPYLDRVLVVLADYERAIARVMARDHCERSHAEDIIKTQASEDLLRSIADDIVINNGSTEEFDNKIRKLHLKYLQMALKKPS